MTACQKAGSSGAVSVPYHQPWAVPAAGSIDLPECNQDHAATDAQLGDDGLLELWIQVLAAEPPTEASAESLLNLAYHLSSAAAADPEEQRQRAETCSLQHDRGVGGSLCMPPDGSDSDGQKKYHHQQGSLPQDNSRCVMDDGVTSCSGCRAWRCIVTGRIALAGWTALVVVAHTRVRRLSLGTP